MIDWSFLNLRLACALSFLIAAASAHAREGVEETPNFSKPPPLSGQIENDRRTVSALAHRRNFEKEIETSLVSEIDKLDQDALERGIAPSLDIVLYDIMWWRVNTRVIIQKLLPIIDYVITYPEGVYPADFQTFPVAHALAKAGIRPEALLADIWNQSKRVARLRLWVLNQNFTPEDARLLLGAYLDRGGDKVSDDTRTYLTEALEDHIEDKAGAIWKDWYE